MPIVDDRPSSDGGGGSGSKVWGLFKLPFRSSGNTAPHTTTTMSSSYQIEGSNSVSHKRSHNHSSSSTSSISSLARSLFPTRRRLRLDPRNKLYFPYEPGKQVQSAIKIKNTSKSHVAFKFQTTAPKSCFMRPPGAILAPGESIIATVFKFVEPPENNEKPPDQRRKVKFKIMSLKVKGVMDYVPELFDEQKDHVAVEQILQVVFLDVARPNPAMEKLKRQLAEAEAALETRKKPPEDTGPKIVGDGLVIDEWKERRERYLARQQVEGEDSKELYKNKMSYLSRAIMAASVAVVEGHTDRCFKHKSSFRAIRTANTTKSSSIGMLDSGAGDDGCKWSEVDESLHKVMLLNSWAQS